MNPPRKNSDDIRRGLTLEQFTERLSEYLPRAYIKAYSGHIGSLWENGCTIGETVIYARAFLLAPVLSYSDAPFVPPTLEELGESETPHTPHTAAIDTARIAKLISDPANSAALERLLRDLKVRLDDDAAL